MTFEAGLRDFGFGRRESLPRNWEGRLGGQRRAWQRFSPYVGAPCRKLASDHDCRSEGRGSRRRRANRGSTHLQHLKFVIAAINGHAIGVLAAS